MCVHLWPGERTVYELRVSHLTEEAPMVAIPKIVGLMSRGFLLCLGLSNAASAADAMKTGQPDRQGGQAGLKGGHMITGEVLRVEGENAPGRVRSIICALLAAAWPSRRIIELLPHCNRTIHLSNRKISASVFRRPR